MRLDEIDMRIVCSLVKSDDPRNLKQVAGDTGLPLNLFYNRIRKMRQEGILSIHAVPRYSSVGLVPLLIVVPQKYLRKAVFFKKSRYILISGRSIGKLKGSIFILTLPEEGVLKIYEYWEDLYHKDMEKPLIFLLSDPHYISNPLPSCTKQFYLEWMKEARKEVKVSSKVDALDVSIVALLEEDGWLPLTKVANKLDERESVIRYHYQRHVKEKLIRGFRINFRRWRSCITFLINIKFTELEAVKNCIEEILKTPSSLIVFNSLGDNIIHILIKTPIDYICTLNSVIRKALYKTRLMDLDLSVILEPIKERKMIPYEFYRRYRWILDF